MADKARPKVTGGSILAGNFSFSSPDGSVEFDGGPAQGQISARVPGSVVPTAGGLFLKSYESEILDTSLLGATVDLLPQLTGYLAAYVSVQPVFPLGVGGTIGTGAKWTIGQNVTHDDWHAESDGPAIVGVDPAVGKLAQTATLITVAGFIMSDLDVPPVAEITQALVGASAFVRLITTVALVPIANY